jgi:predicted DNA-binding ribbon-helix-helix protein
MIFSVVIPGRPPDRDSHVRAQAPVRARNPAKNTEIVAGFRVGRFGASRNDHRARPRTHKREWQEVWPKVRFPCDSSRDDDRDGGPVRAKKRKLPASLDHFIGVRRWGCPRKRTCIRPRPTVLAATGISSTLFCCQNVEVAILTWNSCASAVFSVNRSARCALAASPTSGFLDLERGEIMSSRPIRVDGTKTPIRLERDFWLALKEIAESEGQTLEQLIRSINSHRDPGTVLACAIRVYVLMHYQRLNDELRQFEVPAAGGVCRATKITSNLH